MSTVPTAQTEITYRFVGKHSEGELTPITENNLDPIKGMEVKTVPGDEWETKTIQKVHVIALFADREITVYRNRISSDAKRFVEILNSDRLDAYALLIKHQFAARVAKLLKGELN